MSRMLRWVVICWAVAMPAYPQLPSGNVTDSDNRSWSRQFPSRDPQQGVSVSPAGGDAALSIPFPFPRGSGGFTPTLSLDYNSGDLRNGPLGVGWRLGVSCIERRTVPKLGEITELVTGTQHSRLIEVGVQAHGPLYALRTGTTGPFFFYDTAGDYWTYVDAVGTEWVYGRHPSLHQATRTSTRSWYFEEAVNSYHHRIVSSYIRSGDELLLAAIAYVEQNPPIIVPRDANGTIANLCAAFHYCVELAWEPRPDPLVGAEDGNVFWLRDRLTRIDLKSAGIIRLSWLLTYMGTSPTQVGRTERSVLQEITRRGYSPSSVADELVVHLTTSASTDNRWNSSTWAGIPPPFPNGLSTVGDFDGDGRSDVMGAPPFSEKSDTWVFARSEGANWFDINGAADLNRALKVAWPPGPFRLPPLPIWMFFEDGDPCKGSLFDSQVWELPPSGSSVVGDYDGNGLSDIAFALWTDPRPPATTVPWEMFLSSGDGWLGSSREHPVMTAWRSGPQAEMPKIDCKMPRHYSLGVYCRGGSFDEDDRDDIACFSAKKKRWQIGHAAINDWNVEEVDVSSFAPAQEDPSWGEDCFVGDLDGDGIDEIVCPSSSHRALEVLRRSDRVPWNHETWSVEMSAGVTLSGCLPASLNEDARTDIICSTSTPGQWLLAISDGRAFRDGMLSSGFQTSDLHEHCFAADMDNDSRTDLVCLAKAPNQFVIGYVRGLELSSPEPFVPPIPASISSEPGWCRFGDFNGDTALDAVCVASDFGSSIVTQPTVAVPDALRGYVDALGAVTWLAFAPAADEKLAKPVVRRRYLKSVEVDPGAGQPVSRKVFSYGGKVLGRYRAPTMTFSVMTEKVSDISGGGTTHLSSSEVVYDAWGGDHDPMPIITTISRSDAAGCALLVRELSYTQSTGVVKGAPLLEMLRESEAAEPSPGGACNAAVEVRSEQLEYDNQDRVACTKARSDSAGPWKFSCFAYEPGNVAPSSISDRTPRIIRTGVFTPCDAGATDCHTRTNYEELSASTSVPDSVRTLSRRRLEFGHSLAPCQQRTAGPAWTNAPMTIYSVNALGAERPYLVASYDGHGNVDCEGLAGGRHHQVIWHALGHTPSRLCDSGGAVCWGFEYSGNGGVAEPATLPGILTRLLKPWGGSTSFAFDSLARLGGATDSDRGDTRLERSDFGNPALQRVKEISPAGDETETHIDALGRAILTTHRPLLGQSSVVAMHYDGLNRATASSTPYGSGGIAQWKTLTYDAIGRVTRITNPDGTVEMLAYAPHESQSTDELGVTIRFHSQYSDAGEQLDIERTSPSVRLVGRYTRDPLGRITSAGDASGVLAQWKFDSFADLSEISEKAIGSTTFEYDEFGRRKRVRDPAGVPTTWTYDGSGRAIRSSTGRWFQWRTASYRYDDSATGLGRLSRASNEWTEYSWTFDAAARPATVRMKERSLPGAATASIRYQYDLQSRLNVITLPDRRAIRWTYSGDRVQSVIDLNDGYPIVTYTDYDERGLPNLEIFGDGTTVSRERDALGRLKRIELNGGGTQERFDVAYTPVGNLQEVLRDGIPALQSGFDEEGRITFLSTSMATRHFTYDTLANTETVTPGPGLEYHAQHPHAVSSVDGNSLANDSLLQATRFGPVSIHYLDRLPARFTYGWRFWRNETVSYDALGNPYYLSSGDGDEKRAFGLWRQHSESCHVGIPSPFGTVAISRCGSRSYESVHSGPGPLLLATSQRVHGIPVFADGGFDPYIPLARPELEALLRPTTQTLRNSILQVRGRRVIAPSIGRFLQPDPIYPPQSSFLDLNRYAYARSNPLRFADPLGLQSDAMSMSTGWSLSPMPGSFAGPTFNFFSPTSFQVPTIGPITIASEFSASTTTANVQSLGPRTDEGLRSWFTYKGEPWLEFNIETELSVGSSFGIGPTFSPGEGTFALSLPMEPAFVEFSTGGSVTLGLNFIPEFTLAGAELSLLEAGPIVSYKRGTGDISFGVQGRAFGVTGLVTTTPSVGTGLLLFYRDLEAAITSYVCSMGCGGQW